MNTQFYPSFKMIIRANWWLFFLLLVLFSIGLVNLHSACAIRHEGGFTISEEFQKQIIWGLCGLAAMVVCMVFDYRYLRRLAWPIYIFSIILLVLVLSMGHSAGGAQRWINLGFFKLQPSELAKVSVLILGAHLLSLGKAPLGWIQLTGLMLVGVLPAFLTKLQPDLGTSLNIVLILGGMFLYRGLRRSVLIVALIVALLSPIVIWKAVWPNLHGYQKERIMTFINPEEASKDAVYNIKQSHISVGSGRVWGNGYMGGGQSKLGFLPARKTDFAVAVFGEEWGFAGCVSLTALFTLFLLSVFSTARNAKDRFGSMLCIGIYFYFFWQILINMGMVIGLMPVVGIPLPFISYGGTTTMVNFSMAGLVLNVSMRKFLFKT